MKTTLALIVSSCILVAVCAGKCIEQEECDEGTCCAGVPPFGGVCMPLTPEGGKCHVVDKVIPIFGDFYIGSCPCDEGLVCVQQGKKKNDGICQVPPTTGAETTEAAVDEETVAIVDKKSTESAESVESTESAESVESTESAESAESTESASDGK